MYHEMIMDFNEECHHYVNMYFLLIQSVILCQWNGVWIVMCFFYPWKDLLNFIDYLGMLDALTINDYFLQSNYLESVFKKTFVAKNFTLRRYHVFSLSPWKEEITGEGWYTLPHFHLFKTILSPKERRWGLVIIWRISSWKAVGILIKGQSI